jgi:hypothetical protein
MLAAVSFIIDKDSKYIPPGLEWIRLVVLYEQKLN